ncbi:hypothetical protein PBI_GRETELLYN_66 [Gordonia phage GretelLyn]|uniref:Uncharacterized protein n=8 Tax=Lambovirus TaxID=2843412 RepID=A0A5J6TKR9_9CAUD|nr:hypothetical protein HWC68_gp68 [Gordonia phage Gibbin]YP_009852518.1 hypothetical protein HWC69_gp066 [Gordonia phage Ranch]YP_009852718.1 hypothetical protein HWC71_gp67 [Gordonia phage Sadboi]YP_009854022.1 hypothetical protein HWC82_gp68 [Gordonia phage Yikes]QFG08204.1 hypothetical protein PBI_GRETELLYN_66 [Gordonia phage GretelLyn]UVT31046.1 hypothetical protein SEA_PARVUSTARDA_65 [Gordonia phage ParvusTarda]UVT31763.1 hypothetical protein SEA_PATOS_70 [Gordonia phage Patos]WNN95326
MARSLNTKGREELALVRKRVIRQEALGRISAYDARVLLDKINELDALIIKTNEQDQPDKETFSV